MSPLDLLATPGASEPLLLFTAAEVGYAGRVVVQGASLSVYPGEVVGLVGPNGAGKSTLIRVVTGEAELLGGSVELTGEPLSGFSPRERARVVGVVPQQVAAAFSFPAREFVEMGRHPHLPRFGAPGEADATAVSAALALTDTEHLSERAVDELSGGDLQRLALAQALAQQPQLLLLDEPTSHLDLNHRLQVLDLVHDLAASEHLGILAVFHDLDLAARYADRIAVVADGSVGEAAAPEKVITAEMVRTVFGVRAVVGPEPVTGATSVIPVLRDGAVIERGGRVLVIGGSGVAAGLMRRLVLAGRHVSAGALNAGDADAVVAEALGIEFPEIPPFAPMDDAASTSVARLAALADAIVVTDVPFGNGNLGNLQAAVEAGRPLVLVGSIERRDYTDGAAEKLWRTAVAAGAVVVADALEAENEVERFLG